MIKMLVTDIDGTIMMNDTFISQNIRDCFRSLSEKGIKIVLATGRMYSSTANIAKDLGLDTPVICYQGGYIRNIIGDAEVLWEKGVEHDIAKDVISFIKSENIHINLYANDELYVENDNDIIQEYSRGKKVPYSVVSSFDDLDAKEFNKILAIDNSAEKIENLVKLLQDKYSDKLYIIRSTPYFCEVSNKEATKGKAVEYLAGIWGIEKHEIMAIGDQDNDIEMLLSAGLKVAMGNATQALKETADYITSDIEDDGAFLAIEKFVKL